MGKTLVPGFIKYGLVLRKGMDSVSAHSPVAKWLIHSCLNNICVSEGDVSELIPNPINLYKYDVTFLSNSEQNCRKIPYKEMEALKDSNDKGNIVRGQTDKNKAITY